MIDLDIMFLTSTRGVTWPGMACIRREIDRIQSDRNLCLSSFATLGDSTAISVRSTFSIATLENLESVVAAAVEDGACVLVATEETLASSIISLARTYSNDIKFVVFSAENLGNTTNNVLIVRPRWFRAMYLAGVVCGMASKNSKVGLILQKPTSMQLILYANAFYVGVMSAGQNLSRTLTVGMATVDAWNTSVAAQAAAGSLLKWGAGCLTSAQANSVANQKFGDKQLPSVGFASNARIFSGDRVLTSFLINPAPTFTNLMQLAISNEWDDKYFIYSSPDVERGDWSVYVNQTMRKRIDAFVQANNQDAMMVFCKQALTRLGLTLPFNDSELNNVTGCPPNFTFVWDPNVMKLTNAIVKVADWTTYSATNRVYWRWTDSLSIIFYVIGGILIVFSIYLIPHIIYYRKTRVYATASWLVLLMVPISLLITICSGATYLGSPTDAQCHLRLWIESIGIVILLGALQARNFTHFMWKRRGLTQLTKEYEHRFTVGPYALFVQWLLPLLLADLCLLTFFSSVTPIYNVDSTAAFLEVGSVQAVCKSQQNYMFYLINAFHALIAIINLVFFYVLKNIPLLGTDVVATGATVLNLVFFSGLNIFVSVIVGRATIAVALTIGLKLIVAVVALAVLIVPKWWAITFRGVTEELDLIENSRNTESSIISSGSVGPGVVTFTVPGGALRPKEQLPEFYSESSDSLSISISSDFFEGEKSDSDMEDAEVASSSSSGSDGFGSGRKKLERAKIANLEHSEDFSSEISASASVLSSEAVEKAEGIADSKKSASSDPNTRLSHAQPALRQSSGSCQSEASPDEPDLSTTESSSALQPLPERSTSVPPQEHTSAASDSDEPRYYDEDHPNFREDDRA